MEAEDAGRRPSLPDAAAGPAPDGGALERAVALLREAERPVIMAGTNLYWGHGEQALLRARRGAAASPSSSTAWPAAACPPTTSCSSRARAATALQGRRRGARHRRADGLPPRLRAGRSARRPRSSSLDRAEPVREHPRAVAAELYGGLPATLDALREGAAGGADTTAWVQDLRAHRDREARGRAGRAARRPRAAAPDARCTTSSARCSTATRSSSATAATSSPTPGASSTPTSRAAGWTRGRSAAWAPAPATRSPPSSRTPTARSSCSLGDGAFGFSGMEFDTLARHGVNVVGVMGNNGIWALEKHPMEFLYGYSVAAELRPATRYDEVVEALGGHGELVERPGRPQAGARPRVRGGQAGARQRAHRPGRRLPAQVEPGLTVGEGGPEHKEAASPEAASKAGLATQGRDLVRIVMRGGRAGLSNICRVAHGLLKRRSAQDVVLGHLDLLAGRRRAGPR